MIKVLHFTLAILTVSGFIIRAGWSFGGSDLAQQKWVKIAPHVVDTCLLALGLILAFNLPQGPLQPWLGAKLVALLGYIGFGVLTLRGNGQLKIVGLLGALLCVVYLFSVAFTRQVWPW